MSCYHPNVALISYYKDGSKKLSKFLPSSDENRERLRLTAQARNEDKTPSKVLFTDVVEVRCKKCVGCRLRYSQDWAVRCMFEAERSSTAYFVTLTYNDDHLPRTSSGVPTVWSEKEFGEWMKRARAKIFDKFGLTGVKFFACAEYGPITHRPHYHAVFFNLPELEDLKYIGKDPETGHPIFTSPFIQYLWSCGEDNIPYGFVTIGQVSFQSSAYVARYCLKKQGENDYKGCLFDRDGKLIHKRNPWSHMSRRPGIASGVTKEDLFNIYETDKIPMKVGDKVLSFVPPAFFDKKMKDLDPDLIDQIKFNRADRGRVSLQSRMAQTDLDLDSIRYLDEVAKLDSIALLKRKN